MHIAVDRTLFLAGSWLMASVLTMWDFLKDTKSFHKVVADYSGVMVLRKREREK